MSSLTAVEAKHVALMMLTNDPLKALTYLSDSLLAH